MKNLVFQLTYNGIVVGRIHFQVNPEDFYQSGKIEVKFFDLTGGEMKYIFGDIYPIGEGPP